MTIIIKYFTDAASTHLSLNFPLNIYNPAMLTTVKKKIIMTNVSLSIINDENMTSSMIFKDLIFCILLSGLKTLKTFIAPTLFNFKSTASMLDETIKKSNLFQLSNIYAFSE